MAIVSIHVVLHIALCNQSSVARGRSSSTSFSDSSDVWRCDPLRQQMQVVVATTVAASPAARRCAARTDRARD
jgi:hypothetical protein